LTEDLGIAGSGAIACGLAATAAHYGNVRLLARSGPSADRAHEAVHRTVEKALDRTVEKTLDRFVTVSDRAHVKIDTDLRALSDRTFVVEAVVEELDVKAKVLEELNEILAPNAILASTTSSLSVERLAEASARPDRFVGLHVFNPVTRMKLVELIFPKAASAQTRERALALCEQLKKTPVEVPDVPGFVVNRLLFPYLFSAVRLVEETGMDPVDVDECMKLGAGHPMGPLALLDLVGLDVSQAIGETIGEPVPARVRELVQEGALGRKSGRGLHNY
jgi:3-hydroxybutyryl-CoA dehydrogenase